MVRRTLDFTTAPLVLFPLSADLRRAKQPTQIVRELLDVRISGPGEHPIAERIDQVDSAVRNGRIRGGRRRDTDALEAGMLRDERRGWLAVVAREPHADHALLISALHRSCLTRRIERPFAARIAAAGRCHD